MRGKLRNLFRRLPIRSGLARDPRGRLRDPRFVSYLAHTNRKSLNTDFHDAILRGRKLTRNLFRLALFGGGAWVVLESAKALSVF